MVENIEPTDGYRPLVGNTEFIFIGGGNFPPLTIDEIADASRETRIKRIACLHFARSEEMAPSNTILYVGIN